MRGIYYEILSTGSHGNCVLIGPNIMVDCGLPFNKIKEYLYEIKYLLLTHTHSDHIKPTTLNAIKKLFPKITVIGNHEVHQVFGVDIIANADYPIETDDYVFTPFLCEHDVLTYGFIFDVDDKSVLYATDTSSMEHAPDKKYDYIFIESNHCENKIETILKNPNKFGYNAYAGAKRHLSTQQAKNFFYTHRKDRQSHFIELHQSKRFY